MFVADTNNNRVLVWNTLPTGPMPADFALGQPVGATNLTSNAANNGGLSGAAMKGPQGVATDGTRLVVSDSGNHRVLIWDTIPTAPVPGDLALGQPVGATNLTSGTANTGGLSGSSMNNPGLVSVDGKRLFVSDTDNHRVLIFGAIPSTPVGGDLVLGQPDFFHNASGTTRQAMRSPYHAITAGQRMFVADTYNHRVLLWDPLPITNGQAATTVIGQADFLQNLPNRDAALSDQGLNYPQGLWADATRLFITDAFNHRVLIVPTVGMR